MGGQIGKGIIPGDFLEIARAARPAALEGIGYAIRVVEHLKRSMAPGAEFSSVNGVIRIAFEFFCQPHLDQARAAVAHDFGITFHYADERAAAGRTQRANAWLPSGDAGNEVLVGNETNELLLGAAAGFKGRDGARESRNFQEVTPFHVAQFFSVMAYRAIDRNVALRMAAQAITHIQIHGAHGRRLLHKVAVTTRARHARADVRRMIEPDMS